MKQETAAQDINEMVHYFVENEDNNYSLFNYLNVLSDEVKMIYFFWNQYFLVRIVNKAKEKPTKWNRRSKKKWTGAKRP